MMLHIDSEDYAMKPKRVINESNIQSAKPSGWKGTYSKMMSDLTQLTHDVDNLNFKNM